MPTLELSTQLGHRRRNVPALFLPATAFGKCNEVEQLAACDRISVDHMARPNPDLGRRVECITGYTLDRHESAPREGEFGCVG